MPALTTDAPFEQLTVQSELIESEPPDDPIYLTVVHVGDDISLPLDKVAAGEYAATVLAAVEYARYDAAIVAQILQISPGRMDLAGLIVTDLRQERLPLPSAPTSPLRFEPIVASQTCEPEISVYLGGRQIASLSTFDASDHALAVLECAVIVDLDEHYRRQLQGHMGLEPDVAAALVDDLIRYRDDKWRQPVSTATATRKPPPPTWPHSLPPAQPAA
jgi:hypothetical protein